MVRIPPALEIPDGARPDAEQLPERDLREPGRHPALPQARAERHRFRERIVAQPSDYPRDELQVDVLPVRRLSPQDMAADTERFGGFTKHKTQTYPF